MDQSTVVGALDALVKAGRLAAEASQALLVQGDLQAKEGAKEDVESGPFKARMVAAGASLLVGACLLAAASAAVNAYASVAGAQAGRKAR